jgi:hypothetical protein
VTPADPEEAQQRPLPSSEVGWLGIICYRADWVMMPLPQPNLTKSYQPRLDLASFGKRTRCFAAVTIGSRRSSQNPVKSCQILSNPIIGNST